MAFVSSDPLDQIQNLEDDTFHGIRNAENRSSDVDMFDYEATDEDSFTRRANFVRFNKQVKNKKGNRSRRATG